MTVPGRFDLQDTCPGCGRANELASATQMGTGPKPGDVSICWKCAYVGVYDENLQTVQPPPTELEEIMADPDIFEIRQSILTRRYPTPSLTSANYRERRGFIPDEN